jgi:hypothetical protein
MGRLDCVDQVRSHEKTLIQTIWIYLSCVERKNIKNKNIESKKQGKPKCQIKKYRRKKLLYTLKK